MSPFVAIALIGLVAVSTYANQIGDSCELGEMRRIGKGSYFEKCVTKYETAGCFASWEKNKKTQFVKSGDTIDRMYKANSVGFRYLCEMREGYISFAPMGCVLNKKKGTELLKLNASGQLDNGQNVKCKQNSEGEFSFEFGSDER